ncbi:MAG: N-acetylmuramoyl-L-alanine amidase [Pirellulaceae bacterium]
MSWPAERFGLVVAAALLFGGTPALEGSGRGAEEKPRPGEFLQRRGDEIVVCGQLVHTGAPVVLWLDPGGYDAYRVQRRFAPWAESSWQASQQLVPGLRTPNRYGMRTAGLGPDEIEQLRNDGWDLARLRRVVDQFVLHYDACGTSRRCFAVLHDVRGLSVHFLLDLDGTIYQTLDLKERAWHATIANTRSIGIEIANIGAFEVGKPAPFDRWYGQDSAGHVRIRLPDGADGIRTKGFIGRPVRPQPIVGTIQGKRLRQYDLTRQQYDSLIQLTATLCQLLPRIVCDYPRDERGELVRQKLPDDQLRQYHGILGHFHVQTNKVDPGPAFQWDRVIGAARRILDQPR